MTNLRLVHDDYDGNDHLARQRRGSTGAAIGELVTAALAGQPPLEDADAWARRDEEVQKIIADRAAAAERIRLERRARALTDERELGDAALPMRAMEWAAAQLGVPMASAPPAGAVLSQPMQGAHFSAGKTILVLSGPCGTGKTAAACWLALQSTYTTWHYAHAARFLAESRYERGRSDLRSVWARGALILDDLGMEYADAKGSFLADLDELVDAAYARRRPLVITTNQPRDDFKKRYPSERLIQRLREAASWREFGSAPCLRPAPPPQSPEREPRR